MTVKSVPVRYSTPGAEKKLIGLETGVHVYMMKQFKKKTACGS
ncbi:MAG: hypothetical protein ABJN84_13545 [Flavobacteriaceae bacterium]